MSTLTVRLVGGPTALIDYGGLRLLTDPTFSPAGPQQGLGKVTDPAVDVDEIGAIDLVLLSHDQHADNLDLDGRVFLPRAEHVLTTSGGARRLGGNATGLDPGDSVELPRPDGGSVTVMATPAQHGPPGCERLTGPVIGFVLSGDGLPTVYVSGDNASLDVVRSVKERVGRVDVAVLFAGAVSIEEIFDGAHLTLTSADAAEAAKILGVRAAVPVHFEGWDHFTEGADRLREAFAAAGASALLALAEPGESVTV